MHITLELNKQRALFTSKYPRKEVDEVTSCHREGFQFVTAYKKRRWDGKIHLLNTASNSIPIGLVPRVVKRLQKLGHTVEISEDGYVDGFNIPDHIVKNWRKPFFIPDQVGEYPLREHQLEQVKACLDPNRLIPYCGIIKAATRSGKSITMAALLAAVNAPSVILVYGNALVNQLYETLLSCFGPDKVGVIRGGEWNPRLFTVASVSTLTSRLKKWDSDPEIPEFMENLTLVAGDEIHRASSRGWVDVLKNISAPMRFGFSGTPIKKLEDRDLILLSQMGPVIHEFNTENAQRKGLVSEAHLTAVYVEIPQMWELSWVEAKQTLLIDNDYRHKLIAQLVAERVKNNRKILVMAGNSVPLAHNLAEACEKELGNGVVDIVTGETDIDEVLGVFEKFKKKKAGVLCTTLLADEGLDFPGVNGVVLAGGGKSFSKAIQRIGRGLMVKEDGSALEVIDIVDLTNKYLVKHSQARMQHYEDESLFKTSTEINASSFDFGRELLYGHETANSAPSGTAT